MSRHGVLLACCLVAGSFLGAFATPSSVASSAPAPTHSVPASQPAQPIPLASEKPTPSFSANPVPASSVKPASSTPAEGWVPEPPRESELLPSQRGPSLSRTILRYTVFGGTAAALLVTAAGIGMSFSAAGDNFDIPEIHEGLRITISGTVLVSAFSLISEALRAE